MNDIHRKFFALLQLGIGASADIPDVAPDEWQQIYVMAQQQALIGIAFDGLRLMGRRASINEELLMQWYIDTMQMENLNRLTDATVNKVVRWFTAKGFSCCLLKGQGNALMYPQPLHRASGDIDLWLNASPRNVVSFVRSLVPGARAIYHHIDFPVIDGVPVEVHFRPVYLLNLVHNARLQRYFRDNAPEQFAHDAKIAGNAVAVPTDGFNAVFQLAHIYNHLFTEGVGLRQLLDYYYVIKRLDASQWPLLQRRLRHFGLHKFAGAVMYVLGEVFAMPASAMPVAADERRGRQLTSEILQGGNFGHYDDRRSTSCGTLGGNLQRFRRDLRLLRSYPDEAIAEPIFRIFHFLWRRKYN